ncbi:hypothetical protein VTL71DRAFT_9476 [Oculimacula yallundae]|uniref:WSC domain-containing protein n=1 Tax=Oculimacula yallundae TaxID=86028 RepID=A0ABR4BS17_9HELO
MPNMSSTLFKVVTLCLVSFVSAGPHLLSQRDVDPNMAYDPATTKYCTYWFDNYLSSSTCADVMIEYGLTLEKMTRWNPSLKAVNGACTGWTLYRSYCIDAYLEPASTTATRPSTTTTSTTATPSVNWSLLGCYTDDENPRTLANRIPVSGGEEATTIEKCQTTCWSSGYKYAGVEFGGECYCGNAIKNLPLDKAVAAQECNVPCKGNKSQMCGGPSKIHIFEGKGTGTTVPSPTPTADWTLLGCFGDNENPRTLEENGILPGSGSKNSITSCQNTCWERGWKFAGVEYSSECYCGNSIRNELLPKEESDAQCTMACAGNSAQICGGPSRIQVFEGKPKAVSSSTTRTTTTTLSPAITTTKTSTATGPAVTARETWTHLGCYEDFGARTLDTTPTIADPTKMTIEVCQKTCKSLGKTYAGVEFGKECYCGNKIGGDGFNYALTDCNVPCAGNSTQICGGPNKLNIYQYAVLEPTWVTLGCYTDLWSVGKRVLSFDASDLAGKATLTTAKCKSTCAGKGYMYSGTEVGNECWCDNSLRNGGAPASDGSVGCSFKCAGNSSEICGGSDRLSLYYRAPL